MRGIRSAEVTVQIGPWPNSRATYVRETQGPTERTPYRLAIWRMLGISISIPAPVAHSPAVASKREGERERAIAIAIKVAIAIAISIAIVFGCRKTAKTPHLNPPQIVRPRAALCAGSRAYVARELDHGPQMNSYFGFG